MIRLITLLCCLSFAFSSYAVPTRKVFTSEAATLTLNKNNVEIVLPDGASKVTDFAASELKKLLGQSLGSSIPIANKINNSKVSIILGDNELSKQAGISLNDVPRDGYIIKSVGKNIYIVGKDDQKVNPDKVLNNGSWALLHERGTVFGVYDFLERFAGVRFYFPSEFGTIVPKHETLVVPEMNIVDCPDYTVRKTTYNNGSWFEPGKDGAYEMSLNSYRLREETKHIPNCHGLSRLGYLNRFGEPHPEYFALMENGKRHNSPALPHPGQLCFSSGIKEEIYQDVKAYFTGISAEERGVKTLRYGYSWDLSAVQPGYFSIMPQDSFYKCTCADCQSHFSKGDQATTDFIWKYAIDIANRLKKEGIPGYVTMMAYPPYRNLPNGTIPNNLLVMVAENGPWREGLPALQEADDKEIADWVKKTGGDKVWLWTYANKYGGCNLPGIPNPTPRCIGSYHKRQASNIFGAFMQSDNDKFIFGYLNSYVFHKVAWNNSVDVDALLKEHHRLMFGPAAVTMGKIYDRLEELWVKNVMGKSIDTPLGPMCIPPSQYQLWNKIYSPEELASMDEQFNIAEKQAANDSQSLKRVKFFRKNFLDELTSAAKAYNVEKNKISDLVFNIKDVLAGEKIAIDGNLDDHAWKNSDEIFLSPYKPGKSPVTTVIRGLKDKEYIYFAFDCEEPAMKHIVANKRKDDEEDIWTDSSVEIFLNPSGDNKKYHQLIINAVGSFSDMQNEKIGSVGASADWGWNSGAIVKTVSQDGRWTAEIAIPLKKLEGFNSKGFPVNFNRNRILSENKDYIRLYTWSPFLQQSGFHDLQNFGNLRFNLQEEPSVVEDGDFSVLLNGHMMGKWIGLTQKNINDGQSFSLDSSTFVKGKKSLKLTNKTGKISVMQVLPLLKPNTKYQMTCYVKTEDIQPLDAGGGVCINVFSDKNHFFPRNWYTGTMPWEKCTAEFTSGEKSNIGVESYLRLSIISASGTAWFDDIIIREIKE